MAKRGPKSPRVLFIDIETFPIIGAAWTAYDTNLIKIIKPTVICCWSAQWLGGKTITRALCDYPGYRPGSRNDKALCRDLWKLLDEADEVVGHNENSFDLKKLRYRFMVHGFRALSPFTTFDTLRRYKSIAQADQHKLGHLLPLHGLGEKLDSGGAPLWFKCEEGDPKAWRVMRAYNRNDVDQLPPVYHMLLPWVRPRMNAGMFTDDIVCPRCGSDRLKCVGVQRNQTTEYQRYRCLDCGGPARGTENQRKVKPLVSA